MLNDCLTDFCGFSVWKKVGLTAFQCQQNKLLVFEHQTRTDKWSVVVQPDKCFSMLLVFTPFCKITVLQTLHFELLVPFFCEIRPHFVSSKLWLCIESDSSLLTSLTFAVLLSQDFDRIVLQVVLHDLVKLWIVIVVHSIVIWDSIKKKVWVYLLGWQKMQWLIVLVVPKHKGYV